MRGIGLTRMGYTKAQVGTYHRRAFNPVTRSRGHWFDNPVRLLSQWAYSIGFEL